MLYLLKKAAGSVIEIPTPSKRPANADSPPHPPETPPTPRASHSGDRGLRR